MQSLPGWLDHRLYVCSLQCPSTLGPPAPDGFDEVRFRYSFFAISHVMIIRVWNLTPIKEYCPMEWTTPQHEEICLNCEVSSYANAEL